MADKLQLSFPDKYRDDLESLVRQLGFTRGKGVNVSGFLEAIARREIPLLPWSEQRQQTLLKIVWMLRDEGLSDYAREICSILQERSELKEPIRRELEKYQSTKLTNWKSLIQTLIEKQTPFGLSYADATGEVAIYNIRYAAIVPRERHRYLDAWVECEIDTVREKQDLPELAHNRSFRFDRISSAAVTPLGGTWRVEGLDTVEVEFFLTGRLAHAYERRTNDTCDFWDKPIEINNASFVPKRTIKRNISNTFWFIREVLPYGKDCVVVAPKLVRDHIVDEHRAALDNYRAVI